MGEKQFPEIVSAAGMAAMTEHQGLELRCSATNYMRKNQAQKPLRGSADAFSSPGATVDHRPSVLAGNDGELFFSHSCRLSRSNRRRSGSLPVTPLERSVSSRRSTHPGLQIALGSSSGSADAHALASMMCDQVLRQVTKRGWRRTTSS